LKKRILDQPISHYSCATAQSRSWGVLPENPEAVFVPGS
jgi:hypothetical protein